MSDFVVKLPYRPSGVTSGVSRCRARLGKGTYLDGGLPVRSRISFLLSRSSYEAGRPVELHRNRSLNSEDLHQVYLR